MSYKPIAPAPSSTPGSSTPGPGTPVPTAGSVPSPSGSVPGAAAPFRPLFNDFGPPSMGYVQVSNEATRRPGLPEHLHGLAVRHRGDGQRDSAHLCWQQERHGAPEERHHPCPGPSQRVPGRDRAERPHVTGSTSTSDSGPFPATAGHLLLPGLHPELRFLSCVPWWVPSRNQGVALTPVGGTNLGPLE